MKPAVIMIIVGLVLIPITIFIGYLYMKSLNDHGNLLFLGLALLLGSVGTYCLFRGTNPKEKKVAAIGTEAAEMSDASIQAALQKNNQIAEEWKDTNKKRDKLKMMELGNDTGEGSGS